MGQELFDPYQVHTLEIEFYNPNYDQILQDRWEIDDKTYELATVIFNGDTLDSVGVRYKGNSTFWWTQVLGSPKFPLNIDFNLIDDDQDLLGYIKVKLSNSIFDATFVRESLGYITEGYYLPTSEVGYMNVSINDSYLGLYISVESVNKPFLTKHFGNNEGTFFKCEPQFHYGSNYNAWPDMRWYGADSTAYAYRKGYELKSESGWADLLDLIYTLNFEIDSIETILNVDRALWFFAASQVIPDLDTYNGFYIHNYYLYRNTSSGQFEVIPWDKDQTFGGAMINTVIDLGGDVSWIYNWDPFLFENDDERPFFSELINVPLNKKIYTAHMRTIIDDIYNVNYIQDLAYRMQDSIEVYADSYPNIFPSFIFDDYFRYNVDNYLITPDDSHWCGITSTVAGRLPYLLSHSEIAKTAPVIINIIQENENPVQGEDVVIQSLVSGATEVELMVTTNDFNAQFTSVPMYDDGQHNDGDANDAVYGAVIPFYESGDHVKYYIRASNADALILNPRKAEQEFYEYTVDFEASGSTVVINEINYNSADDEFDPDDWVELYNPTSETISIGLWEFKDENDDHVYTIDEDISLGADEYLVLCANSSTFADLFPNIENYIGDIGFGLSGGGELIRLFDSSGVLVDAVEYDDSDPWPEEPDGDGPTLELINPSLDNAQPESWAASAGYGSPGSLNSFNLSNEDEVLSATEFILHNNYPNPFNPTTTISFILPNESFVSIFIIDMLGRMVKVLANGERMNGYQKVIWDGTNDKGLVVAAGVYLYKIQAGEFVQTKKMVLLK